MDSLALLTAGLLPAIVIGILGHKLLFRKTPLVASKAILAVMLGVAIAVPTYYIEGWFHDVCEADMSSWWQAILMAFITVALVEELLKVAMLWLSNYIVPIDEPMDLLAISLLIGMGFAGVENILYSYSKGWEVALFRSLTAVPAHACFALLLAYFVAMEFPTRKQIKPYLQGLLMAWVLHGLYDFFIIQEIAEPLLLVALLILIIAGYLGYRTFVQVRDLGPSASELKNELPNE